MVGLSHQHFGIHLRIYVHPKNAYFIALEHFGSNAFDSIGSLSLRPESRSEDNGESGLVMARD
jgi:hypothetical protein